MSLFGKVLPGWVTTIIDAAGRLAAKRVKAKVDEEIAAEKLRRDAERDNAQFAEERAAREVATGRPGPK